MKINFKIVLQTLDNKPIQIPSEGSAPCQSCGHMEKPEDLSLERAVVMALFNTKQDESANKKLERFILAQRVKQHPVVELSSEDITLIRTTIADTYGALVYGRATEILDPTEIKKQLVPVEDSKE